MPAGRGHRGAFSHPLTPVGITMPTRECGKPWEAPRGAQQGRRLGDVTPTLHPAMEHKSMEQSGKRSALIAIEGIDGAGKTTQVALLADLLRGAGEDVVASKEPTSGPWGRKIRESATNGRMSLDDELEAFIEDRRQHVAEVIQPALNRGAIVLLDRYFYSTIAYQGSRGGNVQEIRERMNEFPAPDLVIVLDVEAKLGLFRVAERDGKPNHFEKEDELEAARVIFRTLNTDITEHVEGAASIGTVRKAVLDLVLAVGGPISKARCAKPWGCDDVLLCGYRLGGDCPWSNLRDRLLAPVTDE